MIGYDFIFFDAEKIKINSHFVINRDFEMSYFDFAQYDKNPKLEITFFFSIFHCGFASFIVGTSTSFGNSCSSNFFNYFF